MDWVADSRPEDSILRRVAKATGSSSPRPLRVGGRLVGGPGERQAGIGPGSDGAVDEIVKAELDDRHHLVGGTVPASGQLRVGGEQLGEPATTLRPAWGRHPRAAAASSSRVPARAG